MKVLSILEGQFFQFQWFSAAPAVLLLSSSPLSAAAVCLTALWRPKHNQFTATNWSRIRFHHRKNVVARVNRKACWCFCSGIQALWGIFRLSSKRISHNGKTWLALFIDNLKKKKQKQINKSYQPTKNLLCNECSASLPMIHMCLA